MPPEIHAHAAHNTAGDLVLSETDPDDYLHVSAGLAVLAGIAAAYAICCARLRGDNHRDSAGIGRVDGCLPWRLLARPDKPGRGRHQGRACLATFPGARAASGITQTLLVHDDMLGR